MSSAATARRGPLVDLPLAFFLPPVHSTNLPSPVSLPLKRGPPTPIREGSGSLQTPKRRVHETILEADDLGTGRSPARRLFTDTPPSSSRSAKTCLTLAPSPPLTATRRSTRSTTARAVTKGEREAIHDIGFVIYADLASVRAEPSAPRSFTNNNDQENAPPVVEPVRTPMTTRRSRTMERSKLGTQSVIAGGKEGLKQEVDAL
ncbi:uncharacterized protein EHS24_004387 [Apiotrichum porosum]|uniref:Uncharacterized protein n=1 Tax=Apiotrichum porosum TaxID=105984 RepID=A0A427Y4Z0_9TREE|nr:uncharacterized protein EHS24_004387 [Apiotrichum porosum]RSH86156.1 hypothetical protein EHS24_004387 [Apiotrichum porosum]